MNDFTKNLTIKNIERNTKQVLYYMAQAAKAMQAGESPVRWLACAIEYGADLKVDYAKADNLDVSDTMDFKQVYAEALERARAEMENDD